MKQGIHPNYVECTVRCPCGNILAGYDGRNLTIRKKGRSVAVASSQANIKITCEDCGRRIDVLLDGQAVHTRSMAGNCSGD